MDGPGEVDPDALAGHQVLGLTAGASAPERVVQAVARKLGDAGWAPREVEGEPENVKFAMPRELRAMESSD